MKFDELTSKQRELLALRLGSTRPAKPRATLPPIPRGGPLEASLAQERFWFLEQLVAGDATYHLGRLYRIRGAVDPDALGRAVSEVARRQEGLRTTFQMQDGALQQIIHPSADLELQIIAAPDEAEARRCASSELKRPFDLVRGPLARASLVTMPGDEHLFVFVAHHIVTDGWSLGLMERELRTLYTAFREGRPSPLPELLVQYPDFAAWQRRWLAEGAGAKQLAYWKEQLAGAAPALELPADRARPAVKGFRGEEVRFALPKEIGVEVVKLARAERATRFIVLLTAFDVLLARLSGQTDVVVGTAVANRDRPELEGLFGCFANTVAVRTRLDGAPSFREAVQRTKKAVLAMSENQDVPFARVVEMLQPKRDASRTPIYQMMFAFDETEEPFTLHDVEILHEPSERAVSLVDLWLLMAARGDEISGQMEYDVNLFDRASVEAFAERFGALLASALAEPDRPVDTLADDPKARRIILAATYTVDPVQKGIGSWLAHLEIPCRVEHTPSNQVVQQLRDPASLIAANPRGGFNVILVRFEDWAGDAVAHGAGGSGRFTTAGLESIEKSVRELIAALRPLASEGAGASYLVCITPPSSAALVDDAFARHCERMGALVASELSSASNVRVLVSPVPTAHPSSAADLGADATPYTPTFCNALGTLLAKTIYRQVTAPAVS
jgi:hypothetical protein